MNATAEHTETAGTDLRVAEQPSPQHAREIARAGEVAMGFNSAGGFELMQRAAKLLASSTLVPQQYQNNLPNCVIALNMAQRIGADPMQVMQNLYVVHGRPGWSSQFLIATFNQCGRFTAMRFEFVGKEGTDAWGCKAYATEKATGEKLEGATITMALAKAEGWVSKSGSKWKTMPQQMLMYRAGAWFVRAYAPELSMGLQTAEEVSDVGPLALETVTEASRDPEVLHQLDQELAGEQDDAPAVTAQQVHDALTGADTIPELDEAAAAIDMLHESERAPLYKLYDTRGEEMIDAATENAG